MGAEDSNRCNLKSLKVMAKGRAYLEWVGGAENRQDSFEHGFSLVKHLGFVTFKCLEKYIVFFSKVFLREYKINIAKLKLSSMSTMTFPSFLPF